MDPELGVAVVCVAPWVVGPYLAMRSGCWGLITGTLLIWLVPLVVRISLVELGDTSMGGFGVGAHAVFGWLFGFFWCAIWRVVYLHFARSNSEA